MSKVPFTLSACGYRVRDVKPVVSGSLCLENHQGHPFYPVEITKPDLQHSQGECFQLMLEAAFRAGVASRKANPDFRPLLEGKGLVKLPSGNREPNCKLSEAFIKPKLCSHCGSGPCVKPIFH